MREWAVALCRQDRDSFDAFVQSATPAYAHLFRKPLARPLDRSRATASDPLAQAICSQLGIDPGDLVVRHEGEDVETMAGDPIKTLLSELETASHLIGQAIAILAAARSDAVLLGVDLDNRLPASAYHCDVPVTEHRMNHRPGRVSRIDSAPERAAFIRARSTG